MATIQHSVLAGTNLHEPKGVADATSGQAYIADGAGSGAWGDVIAPLGGTANQVYVADGLGGGVWKTLQVHGWENYQHAGGPQALSSGVRTLLQNDGAGAITNTTHKLNGSTGIWDGTAHEFDWAAGGAQVGDTIDIRVDLEYTVDTNNDGFLLDLDLAIGGVTPFTLPIDERNIDTTGTEHVVRFVSFFIGSADVLNNPARFYVTADSAGDSVEVAGWYVRIVPQTPRFV